MQVFVNTEVADPTFSIASVVDAITGNLDDSTLKGYIVTPAGTTAGKMGAINPWTVPKRKRIQFDRIRDTFPLVLAQEQRNNERYAFVCRLRTDTIWLSPWTSAALMQVPENTVAGVLSYLSTHVDF